MTLVAEIIKIKNQSPDKFKGYLEFCDKKNPSPCDDRFKTEWEDYIFNKVSKTLKTVNDEIVAFDNSPLTAESQAKGFNKIMTSLEDFNKVYVDYNKLMEYHERAFKESLLRVVAEERRTLYNHMLIKKKSVIVNSQLVLSKFIDTVKNKPMCDLDMADIIVSKMLDVFQLSAEKELYIESNTKHRKHSHKPTI